MQCLDSSRVIWLVPTWREECGLDGLTGPVIPIQSSEPELPSGITAAAMAPTRLR